MQRPPKNLLTAGTRVYSERPHLTIAMEGPISGLQYSAYIMISMAFKVLDVVFWLYMLYMSSCKPLLHLSASRSDTLDNDGIIRLVESSPYLPGSDESLIQISEDTVVKLGTTWSATSTEVLAMNIVRAQTTIPVPRVRRVIKHAHDNGDVLVVMDFVQGTQLHTCWPALSLWERLKIILTMRRYLRQLRRIRDVRSATPGPLGPKPLPCDGLQFGYDTRGPFPTTAALAKHFNTEFRFAQDRAFRRGAPPLACQPLDDSIFTPLVFTHNDLNMRNILVDGDGRLWIVDWAWAGFYPTWFEYLGMMFAAQKDKEPKGWIEAIKFMVEPAFEMERWMVSIGYDYTEAP